MIPGLLYAANLDSVASPAGAAFDAFEIVAPADACVLIRRIVLGQSTDYGDTESEGLVAELIKGHSTTGSGGSANTPAPCQTGFPAAGSTVATMNTTIASAGTPINIHTEAFNIQIGFDYRPTPEELLILSPSERLVLRISALTDAATFSGTLLFQELGG